MDCGSRGSQTAIEDGGFSPAVTVATPVLRRNHAAAMDVSIAGETSAAGSGLYSRTFEPEMPQMARYFHVYNDTGGESHVSEGQWNLRDGDFTPPSPPGYQVSGIMDASGWLIMHHPAEYRDAWHRAPARAVVIVLAGSACLESSDGDRCVIHPGDCILVEDTGGRGHKMEGLGGQAYTLALVLLESAVQRSAET